jgi:hypothetical protein
VADERATSQSGVGTLQVVVDVLDSRCCDGMLRDMSSIRELEATVLQLSDRQRGRLADKLLASLPPPPGGWSRDAVVEEAARRDDEIESGRVRALTEAEFWSAVGRRHRS